MATSSLLECNLPSLNARSLASDLTKKKKKEINWCKILLKLLESIEISAYPEFTRYTTERVSGRTSISFFMYNE